MAKKLEDKFNHYCNSEKFEIRNQIIVKESFKYYNKILNHFLNFSRNYSKKGFIFMEM